VAIPTTRGDFRFGANNFPVQDYYLAQAVKEGDAYVMRKVATIFEDHADAYAAACKM